MHIAAVQMDIRWEDRQANHVRVRQLLDAVDLAPGSLIVLPEMFDLGFSMNPAAAHPGEPSVSERFCRELAAERKAVVIAGVVAAASGQTLANEAIAFSPDGSELARYRKMQPFTLAGEHTIYPAGHDQVLFDWAGVRIALFICYDLRFPERFRPAALSGAELMVVVANWPDKRSEHWVRLLQARAIENQAFVLGVNRTGTDPTHRYDGRSSLFDPHGREIFQAGLEERVITAQIDPAEARRWREKFPALRDIRGSSRNLSC
jgi:predicted amidohydrolase